MEGVGRRVRKGEGKMWERERAGKSEGRWNKKEEEGKTEET